MYCLYLSHFEFCEICLNVIASDSWLWHRRLGHISMDSIKKLVSLELVRNDYVMLACKISIKDQVLKSKK
jgi:GAG-pre-integrase domain